MQLGGHNNVYMKKNLLDFCQKDDNSHVSLRENWFMLNGKTIMGQSQDCFAKLFPICTLAVFNTKDRYTVLPLFLPLYLSVCFGLPGL